MMMVLGMIGMEDDDDDAAATLIKDDFLAQKLILTLGVVLLALEVHARDDEVTVPYPTIAVR
jgi:hypothetical protein